MVILQSIHAGFRTMIFVFYMFYTVVLNASYEIKICLLLNDFTFPCCFHVFLNNFFVSQVDVTEGGISKGPIF